MAKNPQQKQDLLSEASAGREMGGPLSQLANYSELFSKTSDAVFILDRHSGRVIECNDAASKMLGYSIEEMVGKELTDFFKLNREEIPVLTSALREFRGKRDHQFQHEFEWHNEQGNQFFIEVNASSLKILDYVELIQFIAKDVTEVRLLQRALDEVNALLETVEQERDRLIAYGNSQSSPDGAPGITKKSA